MFYASDLWGGIRSIEDASILFNLGIEKICIQSEFQKRPEFVTELSSKFGKQSIIASVDIKVDIFGRKRVYYSATKKYSSDRLEDLIEKYNRLGAGEVLLNSVERDGTFRGPDLELIERCTSISQIPVTAVGGIACMQDIVNVWKLGASGVGAGSFFVFHGPNRAVLITYPKEKSFDDWFLNRDKHDTTN